DLLVTGQREQQVERAFEAFQVDDQFALARRDDVRAGGGETVLIGGARRNGFVHCSLGLISDDEARHRIWWALSPFSYPMRAEALTIGPPHRPARPCRPVHGAAGAPLGRA